ncbi:MAG: trypsin-like peptidase domain-containing protein, partial [Acholeplasmatales bacterium]|nr:trypsin-like peptidase domain-containing protein [Acholeplasmatales bacterium]
MCIGNPLGTLPGSVSRGVVSYNNRVVKVDSYKSQTLIQTDVAINSGNSGGGLFNTAGALIGIVSAKYSSTGIEGLGFAIPSNTVKDVVTKLMSTAKYDTANKVWKTGYYEGNYEFGFTISLGTYSTGMG